MPAVTVITAAYNSSRTLKCALGSLRDQTFADFEAWIVGDCCTDDSERIVRGFRDERFNWLNLSQHAGTQSTPNNEGLRRAGGRYIAYLGQDDLWLPWHLAALVATLESAAADFAHAVTAWIGPDGPMWAVGAPGIKRTYATRFIPPSSWLYRREVVGMCGPWPDPQGQIGGVDFVLQRRAYQAGCHFASTDEISVLKFPSPLWKTYARQDGHPQPDYLKVMQQDPRGLHAQLLTQLVFAYAREKENQTVWRSASACINSLRRTVAEWYGFDRWPLCDYLIRRHERWRQRVRPLRGLPELSIQNE
jgi:glycosyltransferase involved in cell wall biosynthesis